MATEEDDHVVVDVQAKRWREVPFSGHIPAARSGAASVVLDGKMYVFGGYGGNGRLDDLHEFDFATETWERVKVDGEFPCARENNGVVVRGRCLYLFGGYSGAAWLNDFKEFNVDTRQWSDVVGEGEAPSPRFGFVSAVHADTYVLWAGYDGTTWLNDMHAFDFRTRRWKQVQAQGTPPSIRSCPSWATHGGCVYVFGGYDGIQRMNDLWELDIKTFTWREIEPAGPCPSPRYFHSCAVYAAGTEDAALVVFGGYDGQDRLNDLHSYDFASNRWSRLQHVAGEPPSGRSSLVAQVHGASLFVFGGYNGHRVLNDFHQFRVDSVLVPPGTLLPDLRAMVNCEQFSDVTFLVEGRRIFASKCHLAARSEHFRAMFFGGMRESGRVEVEIQDVPHAVFLKIIEYLYTDAVEDVPTDLAVPLLIAAEQYLLDRLKCLCESVIRRSITVENVVSLLVASHRYRAAGLKEVCIDFILAHFAETKRSPGFKELTDEPTLLMEIVMRQQA